MGEEVEILWTKSKVPVLFDWVGSEDVFACLQVCKIWKKEFLETPCVIQRILIRKSPPLEFLFLCLPERNSDWIPSYLLAELKIGRLQKQVEFDLDTLSVSDASITEGWKRFDNGSFCGAVRQRRHIDSHGTASRGITALTEMCRHGYTKCSEDESTISVRPISSLCIYYKTREEMIKDGYSEALQNFDHNHALFNKHSRAMEPESKRSWIENQFIWEGFDNPMHEYEIAIFRNMRFGRITIETNDFLFVQRME
jgi:hypothetical protein